MQVLVSVMSTRRSSSPVSRYRRQFQLGPARWSCRRYHLNHLRQYIGRLPNDNISAEPLVQLRACHWEACLSCSAELSTSTSAACMRNCNYPSTWAAGCQRHPAAPAQGSGPHGRAGVIGGCNKQVHSNRHFVMAHAELRCQLPWRR